jgi:hypothetical protein
VEFKEVLAIKKVLTDSGRQFELQLATNHEQYDMSDCKFFKRDSDGLIVDNLGLHWSFKRSNNAGSGSDYISKNPEAVQEMFDLYQSSEIYYIVKREKGKFKVLTKQASFQSTLLKSSLEDQLSRYLNTECVAYKPKLKINGLLLDYEEKQKPSLGDTYYYYDETFKTKAAVWCESDFDYKLYELGKIFTTRSYCDSVAVRMENLTRTTLSPIQVSEYII